MLGLVALLLVALPLVERGDRKAETPDPLQSLVRTRSPGRVAALVGLMGLLAAGSFWCCSRLLEGFESSAAERPGWGVGLVLTCAVLVLGVPRLLWSGGRPDPMLGLGVEALCGTLLVALALWGAGGRRRLGLTLGQPRRLAFVLPVLWFLLIPVLIFSALLTAVVYQLHGLDIVPQDVAGALAAAIGTWKLYPILFYVIVCAPLFEECLYRGLLYGLLRARLSAGWAVGLQAVCFGLVHDPGTILPAFGVGLLLGMIRERTGSITAPLALHALSNLVMVAQALASAPS